MKNRANVLLLVLFFLSLPVCLWAWFFDLRLLLFLPALPAFCIQLWLCRVTGSRKLRAIPFLVVALFAAVGGLILLTVTGWDGLLGLIMLLVSISPAVGILLAWGGYALYTHGKGASV